MSRWRPEQLVCLLLLPLLAACQRSVFELPPSTAGNCDPQLVGRWQSPEDQVKTDEVKLSIDAQCRLSGEVYQGDRLRPVEPSQVHTVRWQEQSILWLDAAWVNRNFAVETGPLDDGKGVYLYRYRIENEHLILDPPSTPALAQAVASGDIEGDLLKQGEDWTVRIRGNRSNNRKALGIGLAASKDPLTLVRGARVDSQND